MLQKHIGTESAIGCLVFSLALTFFVSQKFAVLKAVQLAGPLFGNMVGKMTNTCEHQRVRRLRLQLRMSGAGAKLSKGLKGPEGLPQPSHSLVLTSISHLSNHISKEWAGKLSSFEHGKLLAPWVFFAKIKERNEQGFSYQLTSKSPLKL